MKQKINSNTTYKAEGARTEFGFTRTVCDCAECVKHCEHIPGYLIPSDIERISRFLGYSNVVAFALDCLLASPGATVFKAGRIMQIPTLVPRRKTDGSCIFLDEKNRCRIHEVSPYGCAFFDSHQSINESNLKSGVVLQEIARRWTTPYRYIYTIIWKMLDKAGLRAVPAHIARQLMAEAAFNQATNQNETEEEAASKV